MNGICAVRLSAIGDTVNAMVSLAALHRARPDVSITWLTGPASASLFSSVPWLRLVIYDKKTGFAGMRKIWRDLKGERFDAVLNMQSAMRAGLLTLGIKAGAKYGFDSVRAKDLQFLFTNRKVKSPASPHVLDGFLAFMSDFAGTEITTDGSLTLPPDEKAAAEVNELLKGVTAPLLLINPVTSKAEKDWPADRLAECAAYAEGMGFCCAVTGGNDSRTKSAAALIASKLKNPLDLTGKTSLRGLWELVSRAGAVLSPDTGIVHMASALNIPVIGLYAAHNIERVGPYRDRSLSVSVWKELAEAEYGKPAETLPWRTRVKTPRAMERITCDMVKEKIAEAWRRCGLVS